MRYLEEVILNTLILCPETRASLPVTSEDFTGYRREIFKAIRKRIYEKQPIDIGLLLADVPDCASALDGISASATAAHTFDDYAEELRRYGTQRRAAQIGMELMESGDFDAARKALESLSVGKRGYASADEANKLLISEIEKRAENPDSGLSTGLASLDRLISLEAADLCVIAGRPGMGKTALMLNIARRSNVPVGIFSLEMSTAQLMTRFVAMEGVDYGRLKKPQYLDENDWGRFTKATQGCADQGMWINDTGGLSINALESDARRMVKDQGARMICVDYLQLITVPNCESRFNEVSEVSRRLKALAKNLDIPVIALSQLNRRTDTGGKTRPQIADLRESGQIEQDADEIIFVYRPEVYCEGERPGEAELIVAKNREGEIGSAWTGWQGHYQRFVDLIRDPYRRAA